MSFSTSSSTSSSSRSHSPSSQSSISTTSIIIPSTSLPRFPIAVSIPRNSSIPSTVYDLPHSRSPSYQVIEYILFLLEVARITTLCEIAAGSVTKAQQTQRITLEWLLHQLASGGFRMGEGEVCHRICRHKDVLKDRLRSVGLRYQTNHADGMSMYIRRFRFLKNIFDGSDSAYQPMRGFSTVALPTDQELTAINVAKGLSVYQYIENSLARYKAEDLMMTEEKVVARVWKEICTLYSPLLDMPYEELFLPPRTFDLLMIRYFEMSKSPGVEATLTAVLEAEMIS
ncbi:hypothetical protein SBRCBS47491_006396 [Sporothrix bragantina]|uniref:Uncharacterized protein n=1 Tax=Sporothrix bragantina TaxID=671064 RepID=A0ABP0C6P2_9PEZI